MLGHASMLIAAQACAGMIARRLPASRIRGPAGRDSGGARVPPSGLHMVRLCRFCEAQAAAKLSLQTAITMLLLPLLHMNPIPSGCCTELSKLDLDGIQSRPTLLRVLAQCLPSAWFIGLVNEAYSGKRRMSALVRTHVDVCSACVRSKCLATMLPGHASPAKPRLKCISYGGGSPLVTTDVTLPAVIQDCDASNPGNTPVPCYTRCPADSFRIGRMRCYNAYKQGVDVQAGCVADGGTTIYNEGSWASVDFTAGLHAGTFTSMSCSTGVTFGGAVPSGASARGAIVHKCCNTDGCNNETKPKVVSESVVKSSAAVAAGSTVAGLGAVALVRQNPVPSLFLLLCTRLPQERMHCSADRFARLCVQASCL
eukprot:COSAG01_NODE_1743_length_9354_cov_76.987574_1_plen_369_part_00